MGKSWTVVIKTVSGVKTTALTLSKAAAEALFDAALKDPAVKSVAYA